MTFLGELNRQTEETQHRTEQQSGLWIGHSVFQADAYVLEYAGSGEAQVGVYLRT